MFNILIIDFDEDFAVKTANSIIAGIDGVKIYIGSEKNDVDRLLRRIDFGLVIINALLRNGSKVTAFGLAYADKLRHFDKYRYTDIIMYSRNYMESPIRLRQLHIADFFEVPFDKEELNNVIKFIIGKNTKGISREERILYLKSGDMLYQISEAEIRCIEYKRRDCVLHMSGRDIECTRSELKDIIDSIDINNYIECGRGDIISINNVEYFDFGEMKVIMKDNSYTPRITKSGKDNIYKKISEEKENVIHNRRMYDYGK